MPAEEPGGRWRRWRADAVAGLPNAVASIPDGMAGGVLAGVSPVHGLYASFAGPVAGGLTSSTRLMVITTTSAAALAAGDALRDVPPERRVDALVILTLMAGGLMVAAGLLRLGRFTRFVSHSVMTGLLAGVAVNIVLGQLPDLVGAPASGATPVAKAADVLLHPGRIVPAAALTGLAAWTLMLLMARTRLASVGALVALAVPTAVVAAVGIPGVARVSDGGPIPTGVPLPGLPDLAAFEPGLVAGAAAVAVIVLVQGVGVAETAPNPDGSPPRPNRDFVAQGLGNVCSGLFAGLPVGGSVGSTALNIAAGGRTRWAAVAAGGWMVAILAVFSTLVARVAMPTLAAILIYAAAGSLRPGEMRDVLRTGLIPRVASVATFTATLFLPVAAAVGVGVVLSLVLQLNQEAVDLRIVALEPTPDGRLIERPAPAHPASSAVTMLDVYGSLLYAGARTLQARLPDPAGSTRPVVVLRLRGRALLGATFFHVLADYAQRLTAVRGRLYLSGVDPKVAAQLRRSATVAVRVFSATAVIGDSSRAAYAEAQVFLVEGRADPSPVADGGPPDSDHQRRGGHPPQGM